MSQDQNFIARTIFIVGFAANTVVYRYAGASGAEMLDVTTGATLIAGLLLMPVLLKNRPRVAVPSKHWLSLGVVIVLGGSLAFWSLAEGVSRSGTTKAGILLTAIPVVTAIFERILGERFHPATLISGAGIVFGGALLAFRPGAYGAVGGAAGGGDLLLVLAVLFFSSANVAAKISLERMDYRFVTGMRVAGGGIGLLLLGGNPLAALTWAIPSGVLSSGFLLCIYLVIARSGATRAALMNIYASLLAAFYGLIFLSETLSAIQWTGAAVVVAATVYGVLARNRSERRDMPHLGKSS